MKVGKVYEFSSGQGSLEMRKGIKVISPDRRFLQYPWGMHICDYQQKKDSRPVLRCGMPKAYVTRITEISNIQLLPEDCAELSTNKYK